MNDTIWIAIAVMITALALNQISISIENKKGKDNLNLEPVHWVLFSSAIIMGPAFAVIIGAAAGICKTFSRSTFLPVNESIKTAIKPAAATFAASFVFMVSGGDILRPYAVNSIVPALLGALSYTISYGMFSFREKYSAGFCLFDIKKIAVWSTGFAAGYLLAVVCSVAPSYVLISVLISAGLIRVSLYGSRVADEPQIISITTEEPASEEDLQFIDSTTGLANRRYLEMFLSSEIGRAARKNGNISVAVFNIDSCDKLSQDELDSALSDMGERLRSGVREYDIVARYSQQRIIVVLPEAHPEQTLEVVERLRQSISPVKAGKIEMNVSVGLSIYPDHGRNTEELINSAHYALNRGRYDGSEKVHVFKNLAKAG